VVVVVEEEGGRVEVALEATAAGGAGQGRSKIDSGKEGRREGERFRFGSMKKKRDRERKRKRRKRIVSTIRESYIYSKHLIVHTVCSNVEMSPTIILHKDLRILE
jgi:hypothetical protein